MELFLTNDLGPRPSIGSHNVIPLCGYFASIKPRLIKNRLDTAASTLFPHQQASANPPKTIPPPNTLLSLSLILGFCNAGSLHDRLLCGSRIAEKEVMRWTEQILGALAHIHGLGIIHRAVNLQHIVLIYAGTFPDGKLAAICLSIVV